MRKVLSPENCKWFANFLLTPEFVITFAQSTQLTPNVCFRHSLHNIYFFLPQIRNVASLFIVSLRGNMTQCLKEKLTCLTPLSGETVVLHRSTPSGEADMNSTASHITSDLQQHSLLITRICAKALSWKIFNFVIENMRKIYQKLLLVFTEPGCYRCNWPQAFRYFCK